MISQFIKKVNLSQIFTFLITVVAIGIIFYQLGQESNLIIPKISKDQVGGIKQINVENFSINIPKLKIKAPIIANVDAYDKDTYYKALENGVAHLQGSKFPGEDGNIIIFGHSSFYPEKSGNYKEIFKNLEDSEIGDIIEIKFNQQKYLYRIDKKDVVNPKSTEFLNQTKKEQLTLITCVPPGTTKYRLIVLARPK